MRLLHYVTLFLKLFLLHWELFQVDSCLPLVCLHYFVLWALLYFLALQDSPDSLCISPALALELSISPRSRSFFYWRMVLETKNISPKKTYKWPTDTWRDAQHHSSTGKCTSKQQWDITSHPSEWLKSRRQETINVGEDVEKRMTVHSWWECNLV